MEPNYRLFNKGQTFEWSSECEKSFNMSKNIMALEKFWHIIVLL